MHKITSFFASLISLAFIFAARGEDAPVKTPPIQTDKGPVIGEVREGVCIFRGIPYAAPPVGELRWKYTQPHAPWTDARECLKFSPVCPQPTVPLYGDLGPSSEDCLYLNVWTGAQVTADHKIADEKRPVLFWIHGGGFGIGAASQTWYEGTRLADDGAVVVTINYRLGPFGFLAHPALDAETAGLGGGNYGLRDIAQAIFWTKANIAKFGGDPNNITVWGESAGGAAVCALMVNEFRDTLTSFQRAVVMSTNTIVPLRYRNKPNGDLQSMEELGVEFQKRLNVAEGPDVLKEMRAKTPAEIIKAARPGSAVPGVSTTDNICVDGVMLKDQIVEQCKNHNMLKIPLMIGNVADEGSMFERKLKFESLAKYKEFLEKRYGAETDAMLGIYPAANDGDVKSAMSDLFTDIFYRSTRMHVRTMRAIQPNVFVYQFTRKAKPMVDSGWGVYHGSELPFFFGNVQDKEKFTDEDRELSRLIRIYLVHFAKTGNPNPELNPRAPDWPACTRDDEHYLVLDTPISVGKNEHAKTLDALMELDQKARKK